MTNHAYWNGRPGFRFPESRRQRAVDVNPATAGYYLPKEGVGICPLSPRFSISVFQRCESGSCRCPKAQPWVPQLTSAGSIDQSETQTNPDPK